MVPAINVMKNAVVTSLGTTKPRTTAAPVRKACKGPRDRLHSERCSPSAEHSSGEISAGCPNEEVSQLGAKAVDFGMGNSRFKHLRKSCARATAFVDLWGGRGLFGGALNGPQTLQELLTFFTEWTSFKSGNEQTGGAR